MLHVRGCKPPGAPNDDFVAVFIPFQNRSRPKAKFAADVGRHRNLPLGSELGMSNRHILHYHGNGTLGFFAEAKSSGSLTAAVP